MLNHGNVKILETIIGDGEKIYVIPYSGSSSRPVKDEETPKYWQIFHKPSGVLIAIIYNENSGLSLNEKLIGKIYAIVEKENYGGCTVPQEEIDELVPPLSELSDGRVYSADDLIKIIRGIV